MKAIRALGYTIKPEATRAYNIKQGSNSKTFSPRIPSLGPPRWKQGKNINRKYQFANCVAGATVRQGCAKCGAKNCGFATNVVGVWQIAQRLSEPNFGTIGWFFYRWAASHVDRPTVIEKIRSWAEVKCHFSARLVKRKKVYVHSNMQPIHNSLIVIFFQWVCSVDFSIRWGLAFWRNLLRRQLRTNKQKFGCGVANCGLKKTCGAQHCSILFKMPSAISLLKT